MAKARPKKHGCQKAAEHHLRQATCTPTRYTTLSLTIDHQYCHPMFLAQKKAPRLHDEDQGEDLELVNVEASPVPATFTYLRRLSVARMTFVREMSDVDCRHHLTTTGG